MAEASCSSGTPFKRLTDHQSQDLSHHQDRLVNHGGLGQSSFRSSPLLQPSQGHTDAFGTFMGGGSSTLPGFQSDSADRFGPSSSQPAHIGAAAAHTGFSSPSQMAHHMPNAHNWVVDFSRFPAQQRPTTQNNNNNNNNNAAHTTPFRQTNGPPARINFQAAFPQPNPSFGTFMEPEMTRLPGVPNDFGQEMSRWMSAYGGGGNMEDVDAAMDQMARELEQEREREREQSEAAAFTAKTETTASLTTETHLSNSTRLTDLDSPEMGSLSLESRESQPVLVTGREEQVEMDGQRDKSAVAEAAERLLDCVKHEKDEKWQKSVFLSLMRDFRDGKKEIIGDKIRKTRDTAPTTSQTLTA